ncbi:hypothetical protein NUW58_g10546 [Xylaria curta]|uniref:Uncharacterized protein n=1 Tax=Xylaria curta TaxID=42375 RepID=A0ACC1MIW6_9PEZI|nr:hypothetical protein NUW58_g10546 [Xylaria curta]
MDAPRIVSYLAKLAPQEDHESDDDMDFYESGDYLDFIQLGQVLSGETKGTQEQLDGLLGLACSYVLPQTAKLLLARGANPNAYGLAGMNALHCLLVARPKTPDMLPEDVNPSGSWHTDITLNFGRVLKHRTLLSPPCRRFPSRFGGWPWRTVF